MSAFILQNIFASIPDKKILRGVSLQILPGEIHAIMGPNGSGKSTLASTLAGHPAYAIDEPEKNGTIIDLNGISLLDLSPDERAQKGLFLAFQYPVEVPGVSVQNFLREAHKARFAAQPEKQFAKTLAFREHLKAVAEELDINPDFITRGLNEGFSGGEKKQLEILQMAVLEPTYAILDETDSGLDIDAIKKVAAGVKKIVEKYHTGILVITHYNRILEYLHPDQVHIMIAGKIKQSGGAQLVQELEKTGYTAFKE
ncbi:Fe-S cluster assembly ATPase SufC [Candidatus Woesebacteria bacterium]|nr:Fe-S cluster assembly ATPase SufC [Candidatus Woesebacteria bacterium]